MMLHNKAYHSEEEKQHRFSIWSQNHARTAEKNRRHGPCTLTKQHVFGSNHFKDLAPEEFQAKFLTGYKGAFTDVLEDKRQEQPPDIRRLRKDSGIYDADAFPNSVDWRDSGAISDIRTQGECGACWAVTAVEEVESAVFLSTGTLYALSESEIIVCDDSCEMCSGGWPQNAFEWVMDHGGLPLQSSFPYDAYTLIALTADYSNQGRYGNIRGYGYATDRCLCYSDGSGCDCEDQDEDTAINNIATYGPSVVCLEASTWQDYGGGIITSDSGCAQTFLDMNHCVQVVGYAFTTGSSDCNDSNDEGCDSNDENSGSDSGSNSGSGDSNGREGYWIVRNQWGDSWGMNGYAYVSMGTNTCGILNDMTIAYA
ncbi:cysteine proteinase [Fragilariopsis cylindrus CCMP1102]|uniref:Cysteine proteinase n=1 Tax=Fragilariopsis cylindrus CCMP1102 TaxID=635003 RepID=A0A1E7F596_9STRA|nr:cysteine proteinase [Fragilariopsis cylindrus CCMP1102]|eukprot:OEU13361.1 cysteine proteinase [Fragilariopsis cylindrus CCMP1102]